MPLPDEKPIRTWNAIAEHLGCSIKTAQRAQSNGLPVYRREPRRVFAYPSELDAGPWAS